MMSMMKKAIDSKLIAVGILILAVIFFGINIISGSNPADNNQSVTSGHHQLSETVAATDSAESFIASNFWLILIIVIVSIVLLNWLRKRTGSIIWFSGALLNTIIALVALAFLVMAYNGSIELVLGTRVKPGALWFGIAVLLYAFFAKSNLLKLVAACLLIFAWLGPERTDQVVGGVSSLAETAADSVTNFVTNGKITTPAEDAVAFAARAAEAKLQAELEGIKEAAAAKEAAKDMPLTTSAFLTRTAGTFLPLDIKSGTRAGPINLYAACDLSWDKSGMGMIKIYTRPDFTSQPVEATLTDVGYGVKKTGHEGLPAQLFFEAVQGDIKIEMVRFDNGTNTTHPCK